MTTTKHTPLQGPFTFWQGLDGVELESNEHFPDTRNGQVLAKFETPPTREDRLFLLSNPEVFEGVETIDRTLEYNGESMEFVYHYVDLFEVGARLKSAIAKAKAEGFEVQ